MDAIELRLASALQRFSTLQRRAEHTREAAPLLGKTLQELGTALEEVRVMQEQLIENRTRMEHLQVQLQQQYERYWQLFEEMPEAYVVSRPDTTMTEVNKAAATLLNVSQRFLIGKTLSVFVCENRGPVLEAARGLTGDGGTFEMDLKIRPRERAPLSVQARVASDGVTLRWVLRAGASGPSL